MSLTEKPEETPERAGFYQRIGQRNLTPLWTVLSDLITPEPRSGCQPWHWDFELVKRDLLEAGTLITAKEAERRVLVLENPGLRGQSKITTSLYAGIQMVLPGEVAPAHRHSQSALRFVLDGSGAYTSVDGERTIMRYGDCVITPARAWHDHGNDTDEPMLWLDGLDIPMLSFFDASFAEGYGADSQPVARPEGDSLARFGANMLPVDHVAKLGPSPIFAYPYDRSREALESMRRASEWDSCHGLKLRYVNPVDGGDAMPTMATFLQLLPGGIETTPYRSTDATVFTVVEGEGISTIGGQRFDWKAKDIFVVPSWAWVTHHASRDAVMFSFSDRAAQQKLNIWREQRADPSEIS